MLPEQTKMLAPDDPFFLIMELTREEKQELLQIWSERNN